MVAPMSFMRSKTILTLFLILTFGGIFRFWNLASAPVSLSMDEASVGYDAYSLLKTGRDMYGNFLPLAFRSVGDYKSPVLTYLTVPVTFIIGLNELGTRFTVAFVGTLSILATYFLALELTKRRSAALLSSFALAISPWHIQASRSSFDGLLANFFLILAVWTFLMSIKKKMNLFIPVLLFALSAYSYHAERLMVPLLILCLVVIYYQQIFRLGKKLIFPLVFAIILGLPLLFILTHQQGQARLVSVFIGQDYQINSQVKASENGNIFDQLLANKYILLFNFWLKRYLNYWDLKFIFLDGSKLTQPGYPDVGLLNFFEIVPFFIGIWLVFVDSKIIADRKDRWLIALWLLFGPLAASLSNNEQHAGRSLSTIPAPQIIVGVGLYFLLVKLKLSTSLAKQITAAGFFLVVFISVIYFFDIYFVHFPAQFSEDWGYGRKQAILYALQNKSQYENIVIDPSYGTAGQTTIDAPYLYALYYSAYDPREFQTTPRRKEWPNSMNFDKFTFRSIYWPKDCAQGETLFIGSPWSLPSQDIPPTKIVKKIFFLNGSLGFVVVNNSQPAINCPALQAY